MMNAKYKIALRFLVVLILGLGIYCCEKETAISAEKDYNSFLADNGSHAKNMAEKNMSFWTEKLSEKPDQFPYHQRLSSAFDEMFNLSGDIDFLKRSEVELIKLNEVTNYEKPAYLRSLAKNYISQHRFKEALEVLNKADKIGEERLKTYKMLFDVHMELDQKFDAEFYLSKIEDASDFDYHIRLAKWQDSEGNLKGAIESLEKAQEIAELSNLKNLKYWVYSNLGDFYGHDGRISDSYDQYLKALALKPHDAYSKQKIAWIVYSYEGNYKEALRILDSVEQHYLNPQILMFKADIHSMMDQDSISSELQAKALKMMRMEAYGGMYNPDIIEILINSSYQYENAEKLAWEEVGSRPTAQSYSLLALAKFKNKKFEEALKIADENVLNKTFEPAALKRILPIYKHFQRTEIVDELQNELSSARFELGPELNKSLKGNANKGTVSFLKGF